MPSKVEEASKGVVIDHGNSKRHVDCLTKVNVSDKPQSANTDTFALDVNEMDMSKKIVVQRKSDEYEERGQRLKWTRGLLWEKGENEIGPTVMYSLTAKPLPQPPATALDNEIRKGTIHDHPDLFKIMCNIDVDTLENLLSDHPNQPFVRLVLTGLRHGFWPFADTVREQYPKTWDGLSCAVRMEVE